MTTIKTDLHVRHLLLDVAAFALFVAMFGKTATGVTWHEWLGLGIAVVLGVHLVWHWAWIVGVGKRLLGRLPGMQRLCAIVDIVGFVAFVTSIASGLLISRAVLPALGLHAPSGAFWKWLHHASSDAALFAAGLHVALHWRWIGRTVASLWRHPKAGEEPTRTADPCDALELARADKPGQRSFATTLPRTLARTAAVLGAVLLVAFGWYGISRTSLIATDPGAGAGHGPPAAGAPCEGRGPCGGEGRGAGRGPGRGAGRGGPGHEHGAAGELAKPILVTAGALVIVLAGSGLSSLVRRRRRKTPDGHSSPAEPS